MHPFLARKATQFYRVPESTLCDICEGDDCGESCQPKAQELTQDTAQAQPKNEAKTGNGSAVIVSSPLFLLISVVINNFFKF